MEITQVNEAISEFKAEQNRRIIEGYKNGFRDVVTHLHRIKDNNKEIDKIFEKLGFELSDDFREFLSTVDSYDNLVFSITASGSIGIGTTAPNSAFFCSNGRKINRVEL